MQQRPNLSYLSRSYQQAEERDAYAKVPDGLYNAQIISAEVKVPRDINSSSFVSWVLLVEMPDGTEATIQKTNSLSDSAMWSLKRDLKAVGIDPKVLEPDLNRIYALFDYLEGASVSVEAVTPLGKPYQNVNFLRLLGAISREFPVFEEAHPTVGFDAAAAGFTKIDGSDDLPF